MNPVVSLRSKVGITQGQLAVQAGTSQPTIAFYESGARSPTWSTLQKLASSQGLEAIVTYLPRLTREDQRSLNYHAAVAQSLRKTSALSIKKAERLLSRMRAQHLEAKELFDRWRQWLRLPTEDLISRMLDLGVLSRDMRQVSPFAGQLRPQDRARILKRFRKEYRS
ncbi:MAG: helix-turn-helix transcriptional regulator [Deltaproteobacteria bacterium]|nr:helix-turn-helix transcriptional regulator [Deltaproteobacteria bacterium]